MMSTQSTSRSAPHFWHAPVFWAALGGAIVEIALLAGTWPSLGVPGEWTWQRLPEDGNIPALMLLAAVAALPAGAVYLAICHFGAQRIESASRRVRLGWLILLCAGAFGWQWWLIESSPDPIHRLGRGPVVHYYATFSGYFLAAREPADFGASLAKYEAEMARGDVLHIGTHPPGLMIAHRGWLDLFRSNGGLAGAVLATRPGSVRATERQVIAAFPTHSGRPLGKADFAALWAATLLVMLAAAATVFPLFVLGANGAGPRSGWRAACFWPLIPAAAVFIPKADVLLPLLSVGTVAAWWPSPKRNAYRAAGAGVLFWLGMLTTPAMLAVGCLLFLLSVQEVVLAERASRPAMIARLLKHALLAGAVFGACTLVFWVATDVNLLNVWRWNYHNHGQFYVEYERTYWKWLLVNPIELVLATGLPLLAAMVAGWRRLDWQSGPLLAILATIGLLWLSGKNSGEAARLWLFLMPWLVWASARVWSTTKNDAAWFAVLALQLVTAFVAATRVSGFEFQRFLAG